MATQIGPYPRCTLASDNACVGKEQNKEQKEQDLKKRDVCQFRQFALIDIKQRPASPHLSRCDHVASVAAGARMIDDHAIR